MAVPMPHLRTDLAAAPHVCAGRRLLQPVLLVAGFEEALELLQHLPFEEAALSSSRLAEAVLLDAMSRVTLPRDRYEALVSRCIMLD